MPRPRSFDEQEVLNASQRQFRARGFAGTSVDDLTAATRLGKGSLYGAFGDKHQLYLRALEDYCAAGVTSAERLLSGPDDEARERLERYVRLPATPVPEPTERLGCLMAGAASEFGPSDPEVTARLRDAFTAIEGQLAACVTAGQRAGTITPSADPQVLARMLLGAQRGIEALAGAGSSPEVLADVAAGAFLALD